MTSLPAGTVTFLFTDIEGSTKLWESHPEEMGPAIARHDAILRHAVEDNEGYLFKTTGDGIAAAFGTAPNGVAAALAAQLALESEPWPETAVIRSRMGLHTGAAELRDGDYFGPSLNRCARLMAAGHGGQVLLSEPTQELSRDELPSGASLLLLGEHRLKDLIRPETVYQLAHAAIGDTFPPLRTLDNPGLPNNLPRQLTSFVGREKEIGDVKALLAKTSLLTLTGAGGSGKTRLSVQVAADLLEEFPDGVWQVDLAPLSDPALVAQTAATVLGVREQTGQTVHQTLVESLKSKRLLLLLDNAEHVLAECAGLVTALLRGCPQVKVMVTSREPLGVAGELTYRIPSLSLPSAQQAKRATVASLSQFEAVRLFVERAAFVKSDFVVTNANAPALAQLCFHLDGIPMAIELAAARIRSLTVEQINDKLDSRFRLLTGGDRSALPRQQTLRALIDWSYDLLNEQEQALLARLSVFAGGWVLQAAESVCATEPIEDWEVLDLLTSLVDKSLVLAEEGSGANRYRMLETVRQYATEKAESRGEMRAIRLRHRDWCVALAEEAAQRLSGPDQAAWLNRLETEHDNLRAAFEASSEAEDASSDIDLRLAASLRHFWYVRGHLTEGRERLANAIAAARANGALHSRAAASALNAMGTLAYGLGDYTAAETLQIESLAIYRELADKRGIAKALDGLGIIANVQGDTATARALHEEGLGIARELGDKRDIANSLNELANIAHDEGEVAAARPLYEETLTIFRELGDKRNIAFSLGNLGIIAEIQGEYASARALLAEGLAAFRELVDKIGIAYLLEALAAVYHDESEDEGAIVLWGSASALRESIGGPLPPIGQAQVDEKIAEARAALGEAAFDAAWSAGREQSWEQAVDYALGGGSGAA